MAAEMIGGPIVQIRQQNGYNIIGNNRKFTTTMSKAHSSRTLSSLLSQCESQEFKISKILPATKK